MLHFNTQHSVPVMIDIIPGNALLREYWNNHKGQKERSPSVAGILFITYGYALRSWSWAKAAL